MKAYSYKRKFKKLMMLFIIAGITVFSTSCRDDRTSTDQQQIDTTVTDTTANRQVEVRAFQGDINTINQDANGGTEVTGSVDLRVEGDLMRISVFAEGLAPDMMHLQHLQTSQTGEKTQCPGENAEANNDGVVDVTEVTDESQGLRMIPLNMGPSTLQVNVDTYPRSNINGELQFKRTLSLDSLRTAVRKEYGMEDLDFTRFTYIIQGVAPESNIPASSKSVANVPAYASVPVGCAELQETEVED